MLNPTQPMDGPNQGWVFAVAKSIFARTVEKTGKNRQKLEHTKLYRNTPIWVINDILNVVNSTIFSHYNFNQHSVSIFIALNYITDD